MGHELILFGERYALTDAQIRYNDYRYQFRQEAVCAAEKFELFYRNNLNDTSQIIAVAEAQGNMMIRDAMKQTVRKLIEKGLYEIDIFGLVESAPEKPEHFQKAMDFVKTRVENIEETLRKAEAARQSQIKSASSSWSGGGSGITGALKGAAEAELLNVATGAVTSLLTSGEAKRQLSAHDQKLFNLFNNPNTIKQLRDGIYQDVFCLHRAFVEILDKTGTEDVSNISAENTRKSHAIYQNLVDALYDAPELRAQMWCRMLQYDPYDIRYFALLLEHENGNLPEIMQAAQWYHVPMDEAAETVLAQRYQFKELTSIEEVEDHKKALLLDMQNYHITHSPLLAIADNRIVEIQLEKRTYKGVTYETEERRKAAEEFDLRMADRIAAIDHSNLRIMMALYQDILGQNEYSSIRRANAESIQEPIAQLIQNLEDIPKETLEAYRTALSDEAYADIHKPILKAINGRLKKLNFSEKKEQVTTNISSGISNISTGIGGLFKKKQKEQIQAVSMNETDTTEENI